MKWNKALNALIVMFLILNSVLGIGNYAKNIKAYRVSDERIASIKSILNDRGILFECEFPRNYKPVETLWIEPLEFVGEVRDRLIDQMFGKARIGVTISKENSKESYEQQALVYKKGEESVKIKHDKVIYENKTIQKKGGQMDKEEALKLAKKFVQRFNIQGSFEKVKIDYRIESYGAVVTYYEVYNRLPIFDSYIRMEITPDGIAVAEMQGAKLVNKMGTIKPLNPVDKVLFDIEEQIDQKPPLTIKDIQLGYSMKNKDGMHILEEEAIPRYKIIIKGLSEPVFVNAYTK